MTEKKSTVLRRLIEAEEILLRPGIAIAIHAQIAEAQGFKAVGLSGANMAAHVLGMPDAGLITQTEVVENARRVCNAVKIPVIVDCDTGFGNAINVRRTVRDIIQAGAAGLFFEDQVAPKRCGFVKGKELISLEEAVGKYRAAVDLRNELDPDFVLIARTDARTAVGGGMDEVIRRARAYRAAGVDMLYIEALQSIEEIERVRDEVGGLFTCTARAIEPQLTLQQMQDLGLCMTSGTMYFKAGLVAMWDMLGDMKTRGMDPYNEFMDRVKDHPLGGFGGFDLSGFPEIVEMERKYLSAEVLAKYDNTIGLYDPRVGHHASPRRS
ncbi:oxaloacetate decarboxylase [Ensifer sp. YR511]|uniref:isocitrate lyase/PEP mutase family protein n=1 Tax=Ensifer sp. YR511 TaxID=1855294 RepID=UPI0015A2E345|nr:isocitrate lyase/PEP mutase family protein [Ensifer sp. YR511]